MFADFAITPRLFGRSEDLSDGTHYRLCEFLGVLPDLAQVVDPFDGQWSQYVRARKMPGLSQDERDRLLRLLKVLADRNLLVTVTTQESAPAQSDDVWAHALVTLRPSLEYDSLIHDNSDAIGLVAMLEDHEPIELASLDYATTLEVLQLDRIRAFDVRISRALSAYKDILRPLLKYARKAVLVDPYLRPQALTVGGEDFESTVQFVAENLGWARSRSGSTPLIEINCGSPRVQDSRDSAQTVQAEWENQLSPLAKQHQVRFKVAIWDGIGENRMHARYVLTDQFGLRFDGGLATRSYGRPPKTDVSCVGYGLRRQILTEYSVNGGFFNPTIPAFSVP